MRHQWTYMKLFNSRLKTSKTIRYRLSHRTWSQWDIA